MEMEKVKETEKALKNRKKSPKSLLRIDSSFFLKMNLQPWSLIDKNVFTLF